MFLSVILCTHNPRLDHLRRALESLAVQNLSIAHWEGLLIDNKSEPPLNRELLPNQQNWRIVREEKLGLVQARLRGIQESRGELLVFVDDDNVLAPDYLDSARRIAEAHPKLGVLSGDIRPEYETPPPSGLDFYERFLAIRRLDQDVIGMTPTDNAFPIGAGMAVRRAVANRHLQKLSSDNGAMTLGRKGNALLAGEDGDYGYTSYELGLGCGSFKDLKLTHLIAARRLQSDYLARLVEDVTCSHGFLAHIRGHGQKSSLLRTMKRQLGLAALKLHPNRTYARFRSAEVKGKIRAAAMISGA